MMNSKTSSTRLPTFPPRKDLVLAIAMALSPYALAWLALAVTQG